jgi:peptidoglycan hydrolase-like amidase
MLAMASVLVAVFAAPIAGTAQSVAAASGHCTNWSSTNNPPPSIAVYRVSEGRVERVDFKTYVIRVVSREWNVEAGALRRAGAVAVKQYAWYHVLHYRGGKFNGQCFDVRDTTADQLYASKPVHQIPSRVKHAVNDTWSWHLTRSGKFPMTGYRQGPKVDCAANAGFRLYVRSAKRCAAQGWDAGRILQVYYTANLIQ